MPTQPWDSLSTLQMSGRTLARQLCADEARKQPDNLPAIIKIYQWPKVSDLKLWERKKERKKKPIDPFFAKKILFGFCGKEALRLNCASALIPGSVSHGGSTADTEEWPSPSPASGAGSLCLQADASEVSSPLGPSPLPLRCFQGLKSAQRHLSNTKGNKKIQPR